MDYIRLNGIEFPYPNGFTMQREANIVSSITTMTGRIIADVNGWRYRAQTLNWGVLMPDKLQQLMDIVAGVEFDLTFIDGTEGEKTIKAIATSSTLRKTIHHFENGVPIFNDVSMEVTFPDAYN